MEHATQIAHAIMTFAYTSLGIVALVTIALFRWMKG
jgi:hypothetical protein